MSNIISHRPGLTYEQRERAIAMLTAWHFQCHE